MCLQMFTIFFTNVHKCLWMYRRAEINGLATEGQSLEDSAAAAGSESNFVKNHSYWEKNFYWEKNSHWELL